MKIMAFLQSIKGIWIWYVLRECYYVKGPIYRHIFNLPSPLINRVFLQLFNDQVEIFGAIQFTKLSILTGIIKIGLKAFLESVRVRTFGKFGLQQVQVKSCVQRYSLEGLTWVPPSRYVICERRTTPKKRQWPRWTGKINSIAWTRGTALIYNAEAMLELLPLYCLKPPVLPLYRLKPPVLP